jgi:hypothetical protein
MEKEEKPTVQEEAKVAEVAMPPGLTTPTEKRVDESPETPNFNDNAKEGSQLIIPKELSGDEILKIVENKRNSKIGKLT